jgi:hypothetical protein
MISRVRQRSRIVTVITTLPTEATTSANCSVSWGALEAGNLSTAQQAYAALEQDLQQNAQMNAPPVLKNTPSISPSA